jgi:hypothetical protein
MRRGMASAAIQVPPLVDSNLFPSIAAGELPYPNETQKRGNGYGGDPRKVCEELSAAKEPIRRMHRGTGSCRSEI